MVVCSCVQPNLSAMPPVVAGVGNAIQNLPQNIQNSLPANNPAATFITNMNNLARGNTGASPGTAASPSPAPVVSSPAAVPTPASAPAPAEGPALREGQDAREFLREYLSTSESNPIANSIQGLIGFNEIASSVPAPAPAHKAEASVEGEEADSEEESGDEESATPAPAPAQGARYLHSVK